MRKLLIPLLAAFAIPTVVNAQSYWLIMHSGSGSNAGGGFAKIEVESMQQCNEQGEIFKQAGFKMKNKYVCLKGK